MTLRLCNNRNSPTIIMLLIITVIMIVPCTHKTVLTVLIVLFIIFQCLYNRYAVICKILILVAQKDNIFTMIQCISPQFTPVMILKILLA